MINLLSKPKNARLTDNNAADDLANALEQARGYIRDAMEELQGYAELEIWFNALDTIDDEMDGLHRDMDAKAEAEWHEDDYALRRDYYRSVI